MGTEILSNWKKKRGSAQVPKAVARFPFNVQEVWLISSKMFLKNDSCVFQSEDRSSPSPQSRCSAQPCLFFLVASLLAHFWLTLAIVKQKQNMEEGWGWPNTYLFIGIYRGEEHSGSVDSQGGSQQRFSSRSWGWCFVTSRAEVQALSHQQVTH